MAYQNRPTAKIAKVLDYAEILPDLISAEEDRTQEFRTHLQGFALEFPEGVGILQDLHIPFALVDSFCRGAADCAALGAKLNSEGELPHARVTGICRLQDFNK